MEPYFYENEKRLGVFALLYSIKGIHVLFDGQGDSGQIEDISIKAPAEFDEDTPITVFVQGRKVLGENGWETESVTEETHPFRAFITEHVYRAIDDTRIDWYNNEGGFGHWHWDPQQGIDFQVHQRFSDSVCKHEELRPIGRAPEGDEVGVSA